MEPYELTDPDICDYAFRVEGPEVPLSHNELHALFDEVTKVARKKLLEWQQEDCDDEKHVHIECGDEIIVKRVECPGCMEALLKAHEEVSDEPGETIPLQD